MLVLTEKRHSLQKMKVKSYLVSCPQREIPPTTPTLSWSSWSMAGNTMNTKQVTEKPSSQPMPALMAGR